MCTPSNNASLDPPESTTTNDISIGSAVFAGLTIVVEMQTDRPTDHVTRLLDLQLYAAST